MRAALIVIVFLVSACAKPSFVSRADEQFGEQNFKSAVALIELHHVRNGTYPASLKDIEYLGAWDQLWLSAVRYEPVDGGYNLFVTRGWIGEPTLRLPRSYLTGLGLRDSNVTWVEGK
jgi:hypothetical protein